MGETPDKMDPRGSKRVGGRGRIASVSGDGDGSTGGNGPGAGVRGAGKRFSKWHRDPPSTGNRYNMAAGHSVTPAQGPDPLLRDAGREHTHLAAREEVDRAQGVDEARRADLGGGSP